VHAFLTLRANTIQPSFWDFYVLDHSYPAMRIWVNPIAAQESRPDWKRRYWPGSLRQVASISSAELGEVRASSILRRSYKQYAEKPAVSLPPFFKVRYYSKRPTSALSTEPRPNFKLARPSILNVNTVLLVHTWNVKYA
jgi:hypothetical protein